MKEKNKIIWNRHWSIARMITTSGPRVGKQHQVRVPPSLLTPEVVAALKMLLDRDHMKREDYYSEMNKGLRRLHVKMLRNFGIPTSERPLP